MLKVITWHVIRQINQAEPADIELTSHKKLPFTAVTCIMLLIGQLRLPYHLQTKN